MEAGLAAPSFCSCDESFWRFREHESWEHMRDARADDRRYAAWFEEHRAHRGDLEVQRAHRFDREPLFSIVVPCFRSNGRFLSELIESVVSQSYRAWELVLVDSTPADGVVAASAMAAGDERIPRGPDRQERGHRGQHELGHRRRPEDYIAFLDHDDLLRARCPVLVRTRGRAGTRMFAGGPVLRRRPVRGHRRMASAHLQDAPQRGPALQPQLRDAFPVRVAGVDRPHRNVPRGCGGCSGLRPHVACAGGRGSLHARPARALSLARACRLHERGDNVGSKPYAIEAGRLALERHMASRGVCARAEEALQPFVYGCATSCPNPCRS
ncbi:MAG: glycosyltransferase [Collinsella sp.]